MAVIRLQRCADWLATFLEYRMNLSSYDETHLIAPSTLETLILPNASNKGADQPPHPRSVISTFLFGKWKLNLKLLPRK